MLTPYLNQLMQHQSLTPTACEEVFKAILNGANPCQVAALLALLHAKGETEIELAAAVNILRQSMITVPTTSTVLDIVGTGGDGANTVNISTATALVVASCGVKVAKHGNRSVSSQCGSADLMAALGIKLDLSAAQVAADIETYRIGFCYAPRFHPALAKVKAIRNQLGIRTTFNLLGPLLNPAKASLYLLGVAKANYLPLFAKVLSRLDIKRAMVVHGKGLDEITCCGPTVAIDVKEGQLKEIHIDPKDYGFQYCDVTALQGGDAHENKAKLLAVFAGENNALADTIVLNAAVALVIADQVNSIAAGVELAQSQLRHGEVLNLLAKWQQGHQKINNTSINPGHCDA